MIDVMLVLLIIFMVVIPALLAGFNADPPQAQNLKDHPEDDEDQVLGIDKDGQYYLNKKPIAAEDLGRSLKQIYDERRRDDKVMYLKADKDLTYAKVLDADRYRGEERRARDRHDQRSEAGHGVDRRGRQAAMAAAPPSWRSNIMAMCSWWRAAGSTNEHQRHADDRRAPRAADHLHGGAAVDAEGDRRPASGSESDGAAGEREARTRSCSRCCRAISSRSTVRHRRPRRSRARLKEIYENRPEKIIFVKGVPGDEILADHLRDGRGARRRREGHRRSAQGHARHDSGRK